MIQEFEFRYSSSKNEITLVLISQKQNGDPLDTLNCFAIFDFQIVKKIAPKNIFKIIHC